VLAWVIPGRRRFVGSTLSENGRLCLTEEATRRQQGG
jgi:hypothetical protein